jgi:outer membrane protein TolC
VKRAAVFGVVVGLVAGLVVASAVTVGAQEPLTLGEAAALALERHPAIAAAGAGARQSEEGVRVARAGFLPRFGWSGSYTRGDNPVYAFGTLLSQGRFSEANFAIDALNNPSPVQNFQAVLSVEQTLFDANRTKHAVRAARLREEMSAEEWRARELDVLLGVVRTYFGVVVSAERTRLAEQAVSSADADLRRAKAMFEGGMTTRADVLAVEVHRASSVQDHIRAVNDLEVARAALNDAIGISLDQRRDTVTPLTAALPPNDTLEGYVSTAVGDRPEAKQAALGVDLSAEETRQASATRWPTVVAQAALEADRARLGDSGGENWLAGVAVRWDLWKGNENRSRVRASRYGEERAAAEQRQVESATALRVRRAWFDFKSAQERLEVAETIVAQAEEGLRIVRNRYESGLETVTELLRSETALTDARFRRLAALYEQRTTRVGLEYAAGRLTASSEVMQ